VSTEAVLRALTGHRGIVRSICFSPDGKWLASGGLDQTVRIWDVNTGRLARVLRNGGLYFYSIAFSPNGALLLAGGGSPGQGDKVPWSGTAVVWDTKTFEQKYTLKGHDGLVRSVAFSPDGDSILTGSYDSTLILWDAADGRKLRTFRGHATSVISVAFSPDGGRAVSGSGGLAEDGSHQLGTFIIWDVQTGRRVLSHKGHESTIYSVAFSQDGRRVASCSADRTLKIWDARTGLELLSLAGHSSGVRHLSFNRKGDRISTVGEDARVRLWNAAVDDRVRLIGKSPR
jgi:WD40 repeat protein